MMGTTAALVLQLAITAMQHATELNQLLATAAAEGRDVTDLELAAAQDKATKAIAGLQVVVDKMP